MFAALTPLEDIIVRAGAVAGALAAICGLFALVLRFSTKKFSAAVTDIVCEQLRPIQDRTEQLVPNGGSSLHDAIKSLERGQTKLLTDLTTTRALLMHHLDDHRATRPVAGE